MILSLRTVLTHGAAEIGSDLSEVFWLGDFLLGQFLRNFGNACRSLGQPVGSLTVFKIGVPMITCKNDRLR